jgi:putative transcriptional regulator
MSFLSDWRNIMAIRVHLEDMLKKRNMTSKELCGLIGITEANLSILRSGKAKGIRFGTINKICYHLQCDIGDILKFDGNLEEDNEE